MSDGAARVLGFAGGDRNHLDGEEAEEGDQDGSPGSPEAVGEEASEGGVVGEADRAATRGSEDDERAEDEEEQDGEEFEGGEAVLDCAEEADVHGVDGDEGEGEAEDPEPAGRGGEPEVHVDGDGGDLCAEGKDDAGPIGVADEEAGERTEVELRPCAEGAGGGMGDGHLGQAAHEEERDERADGVGDQHGGAGEADGEAGAEEEAGADGSADGDHGKLGGGETALQALLTRGDLIKLCGGHLGSVTGERQEQATN